MKRLVILATCLAMLTFTGCANGIFGGGLFSSNCNNRPALFSGNGLLSDGPVRQFLRGDACDSCNSAAGQVLPSPSCDTCNGPAMADPYAMPAAAPAGQPVTSFYPNDNGVSLGQPLLQDPGLTPMGSETGSFGGTIDGGMSEPPNGIN